MLTCYMCGETKPEAEFAFADMAKGTRQRHCRKCQAMYRRAHYLANRDVYIRREVARINRYRIENRAVMLAYLLAHPCVDCGETRPVMLDFDHHDPAEKKDNVGDLAARKPWRLVLVEIAKCDVRCANCHLQRTARQFNWRKILGLPLADGSWLKRVVLANDAVAAEAGMIPVEMKMCTGCGRARPTAEFPLKNRRTGRRGTRCGACRSAYGKLHYERNSDKYKSRTRVRRHRERDSYWSWLMNYLTSHPCVDCGETNPVVLQFDHRDGSTKVSTIGAMLSRASWATLLNEVAKCDVRCANCHRLRTAEQFGWSKWIGESA